MAPQERAERGAHLVEGDVAREADVGSPFEQLDPALDRVRVDGDDGDVGARRVRAGRVDDLERGVAREVGSDDECVGGQASHEGPRVLRVRGGLDHEPVAAEPRGEGEGAGVVAVDDDDVVAEREADGALPQPSGSVRISASTTSGS